MIIFGKSIDLLLQNNESINSPAQLQNYGVTSWNWEFPYPTPSSLPPFLPSSLPTSLFLPPFLLSFLPPSPISLLSVKPQITCYNLCLLMIIIIIINFCYVRRHLRETLSISNNNDLNKLTVCSLVILGQIFLSLGNTKVCWYRNLAYWVVL